MKQKKQDRRSVRTQRLINAAMLELLFERRYDAITVQDILDRAGIGRSTFYSHYFDKADVLTSIAEQMIEMFGQQVGARNSRQEIIPGLELFQHVQQNAQYFQAMLRGHAGEVLWDAAQTALSQSIEQSLIAAAADKGALAIPPTVIAQYLAGAFLNLLRWWLYADMPYSPKEMQSIFQQLALPGVREVLEGHSETKRA